MTRPSETAPARGRSGAAGFRGRSLECADVGIRLAGRVLLWGPSHRCRVFSDSRAFRRAPGEGWVAPDDPLVRILRADDVHDEISHRVEHAVAGALRADRPQLHGDALARAVCGAVESGFLGMPWSGEREAGTEPDRAPAEAGKSEFSDAEIEERLGALWIGVAEALESCVAPTLAALSADRRVRGRIEQAAFLSDLPAIRRWLRLLRALRALRAPVWLRCEVVSPCTLPGTFPSRLELRAGDRVYLRVPVEAPGRASEAGVRLPAETFVRHCAAAVAESALAALCATLFRRHRWRRWDAAQAVLELAPLPCDPGQYRFEILGSSPPWGAGEEQAWLLDRYGVEGHVQRNVLTPSEGVRLWLVRFLAWSDRSFWYAASDAARNLVLGSPYGSDGEAVVRMGERFDRLRELLQRADAPRALAEFREHPDFSACLEAYTQIRFAYFTWAYYSAFLDGATAFLRRALLLFCQCEGQKPLPLVEQVGLAGLLGGVVALLRVPVVGPRLGAYFERTVERDRAVIEGALATLERLLRDGRPYILGDRFSAADIHVCATLANLVVPPEFQGGGVMPPLEDYPPRYRRAVEAFRRRSAGQYALRIYRDERTRPH